MARNFQFDGVMDMKIREVNENKKQFISLLLLADEQESMVERYFEKGTMYVLEDNDEKAECVVTDEGNGILEIKNIAVDCRDLWRDFLNFPYFTGFSAHYIVK